MFAPSVDDDLCMGATVKTVNRQALIAGRSSTVIEISPACGNSNFPTLSGTGVLGGR